MPVETITEDPRWDALPLAPLAERAAAAALRHQGLDPDAFEIALLACDDARISALNAAFRGKPAPTNVLSWPSEARRPGEAPADPELGDVAIAWETCAAEAEAQGKPLADHAAHLIVHAVLHLLGHDHAEDGEAALMEAAERAILAGMGLPDPYADEPCVGGAP